MEACLDSWAFFALWCAQLVHFSFYDVVLDFALMDAFADLEHPPSTITSVLANRWLTNGFKETVTSEFCCNTLSLYSPVLVGI